MTRNLWSSNFFRILRFWDTIKLFRFPVLHKSETLFLREARSISYLWSIYEAIIHQSSQPCWNHCNQSYTKNSAIQKHPIRPLLLFIRSRPRCARSTYKRRRLKPLFKEVHAKMSVRWAKTFLVTLKSRMEYSSKEVCWKYASCSLDFPIRCKVQMRWRMLLNMNYEKKLHFVI